MLELDFTGCTNITGSFLSAASSKSNSLIRRLSTDSFVQSPALPVLRELRVGECMSLNTQIFIPLFSVQDWTSLRILVLTQCSRLSDSDLAIIVAQAPRIRNMVLYKCVSLTDNGVIALNALGKYLHYLHLGHCMEVTDLSVVQLARNCTRLRYLDLASCVRITDVSCIELGLHLEKLKRIGLVKCINVTDHGIISLVRGEARICQVLERIHFSYCTKLSLNVCSHIYSKLI
jgi:F-box and leucine-rich repeat protein GRR1